MNRQTMIAAGLGVVALVLVFWQLMPAFFGGPPPAPTAPMAAVPSAASAAASLSVLDAEAMDEAVDDPTTSYVTMIAQLEVHTLAFDDPGLRNPFRPLVGPGSVVADTDTLDEARRLAAGLTEDPSFLRTGTLGYSVNGIVWTGDGPLALLNDQVLGVGEEIEEGGVITAISDDAVIFSYEGQSVTLPIGEE